MKKEKLTSIILVSIAIISIAWAFMNEPISQDTNYHNFSDKTTILNIPNFWNVITNIPFFIVGVLGLLKLIPNNKKSIVEENTIAYYLFYLGTILVSFGSGFYHLYQSNATLVWDRIPMTLAFMALFSILITEFISIQKGKILFIPLILAGIFSVVYWEYSESLGKGNLNYYAIIQFYPIIAIPLIMISFSSLYTRSNSYWHLLLAYFIAKICEHYDSEIHSALGFISGHSIKHIVAAFGLFIVLYAFNKRELKKTNAPSM